MFLVFYGILVVHDCKKLVDDEMVCVTTVTVLFSQLLFERFFLVANSLIYNKSTCEYFLYSISYFLVFNSGQYHAHTINYSCF